MPAAGNQGRGFFVRRAGGEVPRRVKQRGCLAFAVGLVLLMVVIGTLPFDLEPVFLPIGTFLLLAAAQRHFVGIGLAIDQRGITEWHELGWRRLCTWSEVTHTEADARHLTLHTARRTIRLDAGLCDWRGAADLCRRYLHLEQAEPPPPAASVDEQQVAGWLGLPTDGVLRLRVRPVTWSSMLGPALGLLVFAALLSRHPNARASWYVLPVVWLASCWRPGFRRHWVRQVVADARRLRFRTLRGWREVGWGDLLALATDGTDRIVATRHGEFWLPESLAERERLIKAIEAAIDAQNHGQSLPRLAEVPDAALSRVTDTPPDAERGLSEVSAP